MFLDWRYMANWGRAHMTSHQICKWTCLNKERCPCSIGQITSCPCPSTKEWEAASGHLLVFAPLHERLGPYVQKLEGHQVHVAQKRTEKLCAAHNCYLSGATFISYHKTCAYGRKALVNKWFQDVRTQRNNSLSEFPHCLVPIHWLFYPSGLKC